MDRINPCIVNTSVVFWKPEVQVGEEVAFQITLAAPSDAVISELPIHSISIIFSEGYPPIIVHHDTSAHSESVRFIPVGQIRGETEVEVRAHLRWRPGDQVILTGTLASDVPGLFKVGRSPFLPTSTINLRCRSRIL